MKKIIFIISFICLTSIGSFAFDNTPAGIDESKMKSTQMAEGVSVYKPEFDTDAYAKKYKKVTKDGVVMQAMELMQTVNIAKYSYDALMGNNLTEKPFKIEFKNIAEIREEYGAFDALGWKKKDRLYIYINEKHRNAPPEALAALLAHEAIHQDEFASLNEETYAWALEAAVWMKLSEQNPSVEKSVSSLVEREIMLEKLFVKGDYSKKYIKRAVYTNPGYKNLPTRSPGFEDEDL
ncbi:MAG: hypothetical protein E7Z90_03440 [Cyanobacteria bacterium SIG29]|nr:hypothetical protein [Cyanobacteria bacterium SIG29]